MSAFCSHDHGASPEESRDPRYRRVLWIALVVNAAMFAVEIASGISSGSVSLLADSLDFLGDAANYALSLWVLGMALATRAKASLVKGASMGLFGIAVLGNAVYDALHGGVPDARVMGTIGTLALAANLGVAALLYRYRTGDSNMRSVWLCTRNDALGNVAVLLAALGVFGTATAWPDLIVATVMAVLALSAAWQVIGQALRELRDPDAAARQGDHGHHHGAHGHQHGDHAGHDHGEHADHDHSHAHGHGTLAPDPAAHGHGHAHVHSGHEHDHGHAHPAHSHDSAHSHGTAKPTPANS